MVLEMLTKKYDYESNYTGLTFTGLIHILFKLAALGPYKAAYERRGMILSRQAMTGGAVYDRQKTVGNKELQ